MTTSLQEIREKLENDMFLKQWSSVKGANQELIEHIYWLIKERDAELVAQMEEIKIPIRENEDGPYRLKDDVKVNRTISDCQLLLTTTPTEGGEMK